jgi:hypothetical protein
MTFIIFITFFSVFYELLKTENYFLCFKFSFAAHCAAPLESAVRGGGIPPLILAAPLTLQCLKFQKVAKTLLIEQKLPFRKD